jgi:hypothetical protein
MRLLSSLALCAATVFISPWVSAAETAPAEIHASGAWARPMPPGARVGAGYVSLHNAGAETRRLVSASSPRASSMEIHTMAEVDGVMRMRRLKDGVEIAAGARAELKPGAEHLMFFNPDPAFIEGEKVPVLLVFDDGEQMQLEFAVSADGGAKPSADHAH